MAVTGSYLAVTPYLRKQDSGSYLQLLVSYSVLLDVCSETMVFNDFLWFWGLDKWIWGVGGDRADTGEWKGDFLLRNLLSNLMFLELFLVRERGDPFGRGIDRVDRDPTPPGAPKPPIIIDIIDNPVKIPFREPSRSLTDH